MKIPKLKGLRRLNGGFGHCIAKYSLHPGVRHNRKLIGERYSRRAVPIRKVFSSVREALEGNDRSYVE